MIRSVLVVAALAHVAHAEDITLAQVVAAADRAPATAAPGHELVAAEARVDAAGAWPAPTLTIESNRVTAQVVTGLTVPLPVMGTVGAAQREARAHAGVVRAEGEAARRDVRTRAVAAWLALARADGEAAALAIAAQQTAQLEAVAKGRLDAGAGAEVDVTAARAARMRADLAVAEARRTEDAAAADLAAIVGWDPGRALRAAGPLPGGTAQLSALRARLASHPERAVALRRIDEGEAAEHAASVLRRPGLALTVQGSFLDPTEPRTDVLVGVAIELPVFSHVGDQVRAARAQTSAERARLAADDARLAGELVAAYHRWQAATETLAGLETDVQPAQDRAAELGRKAYQEGARDLASALLSERDRTEVAREIAGARVDAAAAWIELQVAAGEPAGAP